MQDYLADVRSGSISLREVPRKAKRFAVCMAAVRRDGMELYHVPKYHRVEPLLYAAFSHTPEAIRFCDLETFERAPGALMMAVRTRPTILGWLAKNVPEAISFEICEAAVKADGSSITHVPKGLLTVELIQYAAMSNGKVLTTLIGHYDLVREIAHKISLAHLPEELMDRDLCLAQVAKQGRLLRYVPLRFVDAPMIEAALTSNPWAVEYVPRHYADLPAVKAVLASGTVPKEKCDFLECEVTTE